MLLSGCDVQTGIDPPLTGASATAVTVSATDSKAKFVQELGERLTPGKGAAGGALMGAEATLTAGDPYALLLLPIAVPVGAVIGMAAAPNDEQWAKKVAEHERKAANAAQLIPIIDSIEKDGRLERLVAEQFQTSPALAQTCVRTRAQGRNCPVTPATPRLNMEMSHGIRVFRKSSGGMFTGKPKKVDEVYYIVSNLDARLDMPAPEEDRCIAFRFGTSIVPEETGGQFSRQDVEKKLIESLENISVQIVLSFFEAPGLDNPARYQLAKERQEALGLEYPPMPQYSVKCA